VLLNTIFGESGVPEQMGFTALWVITGVGFTVTVRLETHPPALEFKE
jgi:hypothetical protein